MHIFSINSKSSDKSIYSDNGKSNVLLSEKKNTSNFRFFSRKNYTYDIHINIKKY